MAQVTVRLNSEYNRMHFHSQTEGESALLGNPRLLVFLLSMCVLVGCENTTQPTDGPWTISGTTSYVGSRSPLAGVVIKCAGLSATSGADGLYQLSGIPEGTQVITAQATNCLNYSDTINIQGDARRYIFMSLAPTRLTGSVTNVIDGPVVGAKVTLHGVFVYTDTAGRYDLRDVSIGADTLYVSHPDYLVYKAAITLTTLEQKSDVILMRERVVQGGITEDAFVDARWSDDNFGSSQSLILTAAGTRGQFPTADNIYLKLSFPSYFIDSRVSILDAKLELSLSSAALAGCAYQTYRVDSEWSSDKITYNTQPPHGALLDMGTLGENSAGKYWPFMRLPGVNALISDLRAAKPLYGIVIIGGVSDLSSTYFRSLEALANVPKLTITVRY
jgi:hypothetical protein